MCFPLHMVNFNVSIRHSKRLITINNETELGVVVQICCPSIRDINVKWLWTTSHPGVHGESLLCYNKSCMNRLSQASQRLEHSSGNDQRWCSIHMIRWGWGSDIHCVVLFDYLPRVRRKIPCLGGPGSWNYDPCQSGVYMVWIHSTKVWLIC